MDGSISEKEERLGERPILDLTREKTFFDEYESIYIVAIEEALSEKSCVPVRHNTPYPTKVL